MMFVENSGGFEVRRCSFFVGKVGSVRSTPVRRVLPVDGLCRRGADSWLAEICVVFQKFAV